MQDTSASSRAPATATSARMAGFQTALAAAVLVLGLAGTGVATRTLSQLETRRVEREFQQAADKLFTRTLREIQLFMEVLDSIRQLHSLSDQVTPAAFDEIVRKGMTYQRRILEAYGFAQQIPSELRADYEQAGAAGHAIVVADGQGGFTPAPPAEEYFPLTYQTPPGGLGIPAGYHFGARQEDQAALASMKRNGVFALGGAPVGTAPAAGNGLYMFAPIAYEPGELAGFAIGLFHPERVLETAQGDAARGLLARLAPAAGAAPAAGPFRFARVFSLANQEWRFTAEADPAFWSAARARLPQAVLAGGTVGTLALAGLLLGLAGRARRIEALVRRRTAELADANRRLEGLMRERLALEDEVLRIAGSEKARIGRDLHDSLGQKLTGAMYLFGAYRQQAGRADDAADPAGAQIAATLKETVTQVRRIARGLAPVALTEDGLPDALRRLAEESAAMFQKDIEFYAEREGRPKDVGTAEHLYLIAQEALHNAVKHGAAARIVITLDYTEQGGELSIEDNGQGFAATATPDREGGNGLRIMRHRADVFGGELSVGPDPKGGVRVHCCFPKA